MRLRGEEIQRKVLHLIFGAVIPAGIFYIPKYASTIEWLPPTVPPWAWAPLILAAVFCVWISLEFARIRHPAVKAHFHRSFGSMLRKEEHTRMTGATYIILASLICSIIFKDCRHVAAMALAMFIWGDAVAALVGQSIGKIKIGKKTLEGSIGCLVLCMIAFFCIFPAIPGLLDAWNNSVPVILAIIASLCVTVMELFPIRIGSFELNDNLTVPVVTGVAMVLLYPVLR
jgi:dolichol kinase